MQWLMLLAWGMATVYCGRKKTSAFIMRLMITIGLILSMATQLYLLWLDGLLSVDTGLPLHFCSAFALLSIPLLWFGWQWLLDLSLLLGAPFALMALLFPAVITSSHQSLMLTAFLRLHVLILCAPLLLVKEGKPLPSTPHIAFVFGNGFLLFVSAMNRMLDTNYLFLKMAPMGTPLELLFSKGNLFYICSLEILCMLLLSFLCGVYRAVPRVHAALTLRNT
ncbi:MAG: YwaF family protein [Clostridiales bacterium]|nr:YwaF family protein [Clostridiales bacterium]